MTIKYLLFKLANKLYEHAYPIYQPTYFLYKQISDRQRIDFLKKSVRPGMQVLDLGANVGFYTCLLAELVGKSGKVHAFEPDQQNFTHLQQNTRNKQWVAVNNSACAEHSGTIRLYHSQEMNIDHRTFDSGDGRPFTEIKALAIDDYFPDQETIEFIKIDIQGFDLQACRGMRQVLERSPKVTILGELYPFGLHRAGSSADEYLSFLESLGFRITIIGTERGEDFSRYRDIETWYTDFIAVKG
jgi:FkbM family methyltransferase